MNKLEFQLALIDKMTKPGKEMEAQLKALKAQLSAAEKQVKQTESAMAQMNKGKVVDISQYRALTQQLGQEKSAFHGLQSAVLQHTGSLTEAGESEAALAAKSEALMGALGGVAVAGAAAAAAIGAVSIGGMALSVSAAEAKNDTLEALTAFQDSAAEAQKTYDSVVGITDHVAISVARGQELAKALAASEITSGDALTKAVESVGQVESVLGSEAGSKIQSMIEKAQAGGKFQISAKMLKGTGVSTEMLAQQLGISPKQLDAQMKAGRISAEKGVEALTNAVQAKFGALAEQKTLTFSAQFQHLKDNITGIFADVDTSGFLGAMKEVLSVFDKNSESGKALKFMLTSIFNGLFKAVEAVKPFVMAFLKGMIIIALQIYIAFKPLINTIKQAFGGDNKSAVEGFSGVFSRFGEFLAEYLPSVVSFAQAVLGFLIPAFKLLWDVISPILSLLGMIGSAFMSIASTIDSAVLPVLSKVAEIGSAIVTGLVDGIVKMATAPGDALKGIAQSALQGFKNVFGIHSPSKVMAQMGGHMMSGLESGIDSGSSGAGDAMAQAVAPPSVGGGSSSGSKQVSVTVSPGAIVINGVQNAQQLTEMLPEIIANCFEEAALEIGAAA